MTRASDNKATRTLLLLIAISVALALYWLSHHDFYKQHLSSISEDQTTLNSNPRDPVIATFNNVHSVTFNPLGQLESKLDSPQITHFKSEKQSILKPNFYTYSYSAENNRPLNAIWHIQAEIAVHDNIQQKTRFSDNVLATSNSHQQRSKSLSLNTSQLDIDHQQQTAQSDKPVSITSATGDTQASSFKLNLQSRSITLNKQVRSTYAPKL